MRVLLLCIFSFLVACSNNDNQLNPNLNDDFSQKVIYGDDDRLDVYQVQDQALLNLADSTVGLINTSNLSDQGDFYSIRESNPNFCSSEPFADQMTGPWCSGFLVGPDLIVTAGHCIRDSRCGSVSFLFGYAKTDSASHDTSIIDKNDVYKCAEVIDREQRSNGADWAVVRLDREVTNHTPLRLRRSGSPAINTDLTVIGHPTGLPTKIAGNAQIRSILSEHFVANLDTYGGNSGSAVFNTVTGEVEGILVRGHTDFSNAGGCRSSVICSDSGCRGEDVTLISEVLDLVPEINFPTPIPAPTEPPVSDVPVATDSEFVNDSIITIPDDSSSKALSTIANVPAISNLGSLKVGLSISHTYIGDLRVTLISPSGARVVLHDRTGWSSNNIIGVYGDDLNALEPLTRLGAQPSGDWQLEVTDFARFDTGSINSWAIIIN